MHINEVKEFIVKIQHICEKNPSLLSFIKIEELVSALTELDNLIEMYEIKSIILKHIQALIVLNFKADKINNFDDHLLHTVFYGHPGVGKSKTAKILTRIWKSLSVIKCCKDNKDEKSCVKVLSNINSIRTNYLKLFENYLLPKHKDCKSMWKDNEELWLEVKNTLSVIGNTLTEKISSGENEIFEKEDSKDCQVVVAGRENFVAEYTGQTAIKTFNFLNSCKGKCIIIEEAYLLYNGEMDTYGMEALTVINRFMDENPRDVIIIFTGYEDKLKNSIFKVQPGLKRRCQLIFNMVGYSSEGLAKIFISQLKNNEWNIEDEEYIRLFFERNKNSFENFGGDTEKLSFQCKMIYSEDVIDNMYIKEANDSYNKIITSEILERAYLNYLKSNF